jgi:hypothetical protein
VINNLVAITYLGNKQSSGFAGSYLDIIASIEKRLAKEKNEDLFNEYATKLAQSSNILSVKVIDLMSKL